MKLPWCVWRAEVTFKTLPVAEAPKAVREGCEQRQPGRESGLWSRGKGGTSLGGRSRAALGCVAVPLGHPLTNQKQLQPPRLQQLTLH